MTVELGDSILHSITSRISYNDCDPAGIIYYASWLPLMEKVHTEWWFLRGYRFDQLLQRYGSVPVSRHVECDYLAMVKVLDQVRCEMRLVGIGHSSYQIGFQFVKLGDETLVARARLTLVATGHDGSKVALPVQLRDELAAASSCTARPGS